MKKFLTLALAAVFVVAMATYTLATEFEFGGSYRIRGIYWQDGINPETRLDVNNDWWAPNGDDERVDDVDYFDNRLRLEMDAKVSDRLSAHVQADSGLGYGGDYRYHNPLATQDSYDGVWGRAYGPERFQDTLGMSSLGILGADDYIYDWDTTDEAIAYQSHDIVLQRAYLKYEHPWVTLKAGRQWAHWGSGILESMNRNRIEFMVEKPTWFVGVGMDKMEEGNITLSEDDENLYFVSMGYTGETVQIGQRFEWVTENEPDANAPAHVNDVDTTVDDLNHYAMSWYWKLRMGDVGFDGEYCYQWGKTGNWNLPVTASEDLSAHGLTGDLWCNLDSAKVGMQFGYFSGDGDPEDDTNNFYVTPYNFSPFLLIGEVPINGVTLTGRPLWATRSYYDQGWMGNYMSNCWFWKWYGECSPTKNLSVTGAVGYARANQAINRAEDGALSDGESIGTEMDITATYKLTDNLSYTAAWGYLFTGGFYDTREDSVWPVGISDEAANTYIFLHQIAITF